MNGDQTGGQMTNEHETAPAVRTCRECGCTDDDCSDCVARTGQPCHWIAPELCSACGQMVDETLVVFGVDHAAPGGDQAVEITFYRGRGDQPGGTFLQPVSPCYWPNCRCVAEGACLREVS